MPQPLRKVFPGLNLEEAQNQVRMAIRAAVRVAGTKANFSARLNVALATAGEKTINRKSVDWWLSEGTFIDKRYWPHIEAITDYLVTRRHLRPDVYGIGGWEIDEFVDELARRQGRVTL